MSRPGAPLEFRTEAQLPGTSLLFSFFFFFFNIDPLVYLFCICLIQAIIQLWKIITWITYTQGPFSLLCPCGGMKGAHFTVKYCLKCYTVGHTYRTNAILIYLRVAYPSFSSSHLIVNVNHIYLYHGQLSFIVEWLGCMAILHNYKLFCPYVYICSQPDILQIIILI